jgi:hypothetical protein
MKKEIKVEESEAQGKPPRMLSEVVTEESKNIYRLCLLLFYIQSLKERAVCSLKGFIYDCSDGRQSDRYNVMTRDITEFVGRDDYTYG